jgi:hypothetical protein
VKIASALDTQWTAVLDTAKERRFDPTNPADIGLFQLAGFTSTGNGSVRVRAIWTKMSLKVEFPQYFREIRDQFGNQVGVPGFLAPKKVYLTELQAVPWALTADPAVQDAQNRDNLMTESAILLMMSLKQARRGMVFSADDIGASGVGTIDYLGLPFKVFVDAWGNPIGFVRFPTGSNEQNAYLNGDPQDPERTLYTPDWYNNAPLRNQFVNVVHPLNVPITVGPYNLSPTIVSMGPDKKWGIWRDLSPSTFDIPGDLSNDNLVSFRTRAIGYRGDQ